jgi:hypothetical protein
MSKVKFIGTLLEKGEVNQYSDKFSKQEIVVEVNSGKYPDYIKLEAVNNDIKQLENVKTLDEVDVEAYLTGRKYQDKKTGETRYMTSVRLKSIKRYAENSAPVYSDSDFSF